MRRILVAADGSGGARAAVDVGVEVARATGAWATLVCVRPDTNVLAADAASARQELGRARIVIKDAREIAAAAEVECESEILVGDPAEEIVALADARAVDMIVVGSTPRSGNEATALGGVARSVLERAACPVLVVKPSTRPRPKEAALVRGGASLVAGG